MFALVDCNNFYASCERVFNPKIDNKPVIVLSNNDGCVIARSNESKELGVKMGEPAFKLKNLIDKYNINIFSTNALDSLLLAITQPSLLDSTITGFCWILGLNTLSQEA